MRPAARLTLWLPALLALLLALGSSASADPVSFDAYRRGLADARAAMAGALDLGGAERQRAIARALSALDALREVRAGDAVFTEPPHGAMESLLRAGDDESLTLAISTADELLAALERAARPSGRDPAEARRQLDAVLASSDFQTRTDWRGSALLLLREVLARVFPWLRAPVVDLPTVASVVGAVAVVLAAFVLVVTGRGLRERLGREAVLPPAQADEVDRARRHLAAADEAASAGRLRDAVRELFLFALLALDERGSVRHDPALTDREVLQRAAGHPQARALADLVDVYERAWYGLRLPEVAEVERARELARRVAA